MTRPANPLRSFATGWQRFWFAPESTATLAVFRIAFGLLTTLWFVSLLSVLQPFFGADPVLVERPRMIVGSWSIVGQIVGHPFLVALFWIVVTLGAIALTVGYRSRIAAVLVFVGLVSFTRQMPVVVNGGDQLMRMIAFYLIFAPSGAALSLDRWRVNPRGFWQFPTHAPWVLRLMQIQLSVIYLSTVWEKVAGDTWRNGTALSYALRIGDIQRLPTPSFVTDTLWLVQLLTFGTLALELALGILVWNRAARPWVLGMGALLHLSIDITVTVGFFSLTMLTLYLAFLSPRTSEQLVGAVRTRIVERRSVRPAGATADDLPPTPPPGPGPDAPAPRTDGAAATVAPEDALPSDAAQPTAEATRTHRPPPVEQEAEPHAEKEPTTAS